MPKARDVEAVREQVLTLRRGKYDFNDQHFTEKLAEVEGFVLSRETGSTKSCVRRALVRLASGANPSAGADESVELKLHR